MSLLDRLPAWSVLVLQPLRELMLLRPLSAEGVRPPGTGEQNIDARERGRHPVGSDGVRSWPRRSTEPSAPRQQNPKPSARSGRRCPELDGAAHTSGVRSWTGGRASGRVKPAEK